MNYVAISLITAVAFLAVVGVIFWLEKRRREAWQSVGDALGLELGKNNSNKLPELSGMLDGVHVTATTVTEGSGKYQSSYTTVTARINGKLPYGMQIHHEGLLQKVGKVFGGKDIQVGDNDLDRHFIFTGNHRHDIGELVTNPAVKRTLLTTHQRCNSLYIEHDEVHLKENDVDTNQDKLTSYIRMSAALAKAFGEAIAPPAQLAPPAESVPPPHPEARAGQAAEQAEHPATSSDDPNDWW